MFSIIIPLYNKAPYVEKAIRSVLNQTYQEFEVIVVDDGSEDAPLPPKGGDITQRLNFVENITNFKDKVRVIEQENQGVSVTRNNGVKLAKNNYIAFLDADDWWEPTYLEEMKGVIERYPQAGIYGSSYYKVKNGHHIPANIGVEPGFTEGEINYFRVYAKTFYMPLWTGATVIKKNVFLTVNGFKPNLKVGEDFDLWARVAIDYPVVFLNKNLAYYNQDVDAVASSSRMKNYKPEEHMLFCDYSSISNPDFQYLYQLLAIYGLLPSYINNQNKELVKKILSGINWGNYPVKYRIYYRVLPKGVLRIWIQLIELISRYKSKLKQLKR